MLVLKKKKRMEQGTSEKRLHYKASLTGGRAGGWGGGVVGGAEGGVLDLSLSSVIQGFPTTVTVP